MLGSDQSCVSLSSESSNHVCLPSVCLLLWQKDTDIVAEDFLGDRRPHTPCISIYLSSVSEGKAQCRLLEVLGSVLSKSKARALKSATRAESGPVTCAARTVLFLPSKMMLFLFTRLPSGAGELVERFRTLAALVEDLSFVPSTYMEAHNHLSPVPGGLPPSDLRHSYATHTPCMQNTYTHKSKIHILRERNTK